jgi:glycosyltransferase involved in cell wall biosynthesis
LIQLHKPHHPIHKITLLITRLDRGGSAELTLQLAAGLSQHGYAVTLISGKTIESLWDPIEYAQRNDFSLIYVNSLIRAIHPIKDVLALIQIIILLKKIRPDILHTNSSKGGLIGRFAGTYCKIKYIYHSPHGHIFYGYYNRLASRIFIYLEKFTAHYTTRILNLTEFGRQDHIRERIAPAAKFVVSSCGVDLDPFLKAPGRNLSNPLLDSITVVWAGRIVPIKNLDMLLDAAALIEKTKPGLKYLIAGDGESSEKSQERTKKLKLKNVHFLGYQTDMPEIFKDSDIFVLTSLNEGFGRVLVEAMACGLAIIATNVGGVPEIIEDQINGLLIPSCNHKLLAESIIILAENREMRQKMGIINRKKAEFYSITNYINRVINIYQRVDQQNEKHN